MSASSDTEEASDASSHSTTPNSTSTYQYDHEPFETFQDRVASLAPEIGAKRFDSITRLPGGSFNRIVAASLHTNDPDSTDIKVVLRIPRFAEDEDPPNQNIKHQFVVLQLLNDIGIEAPRVLAYDSTSDNALGMPFSVQTRLQGQGLNLSYKDTTFDERLCIVQEFVRTLALINDVRFAHPGRLCCSERVAARKQFNDEDHNAQPEMMIQVRRFGIGVEDVDEKANTRVTSSLRELLNTQLDAWLEHERSKTENKQSTTKDEQSTTEHDQSITEDEQSITEHEQATTEHEQTSTENEQPTTEYAQSHDEGFSVVDTFKRLKSICEDMADLGFFQQRASITTNVLYHWDIEPRNILVDHSAIKNCSHSLDTSEPHVIHITGVLDWDDAISVPPILARKPPVWLWDFSEDSTFPSSIQKYYDGDVDLLPPGLYDEVSARSSREDLQVKEAFEAAITAQLYGDCSAASRAAYLDDAYGRGRWLRRL